MLIRKKHVQNETIRQVLAQVPSVVENAQARAEAVARTGTPGEPQLNGTYNEAGEFEPFLRCGIDSFDSGRKYAT